MSSETACGKAADQPPTTFQVQRCIIRLDDARQFAEMRALFQAHNPLLRLGLVHVDGQASLRTELGGMRVFWLFRGEGEVFLPRGYRTQEGDGQPLPSEYAPDPLDPVLASTLELLKSGASSISTAAYAAVSAILRRWRRDTFVGDFAGELWKLDHAPLPWSTDERLVRTLESLFTNYRAHGFSTKQADSFEPLKAGDQVIACGAESVQVRGRFTCLTMETPQRHTSHVSTVRRLRYLADTAGGCNPDFDPFRRLPLTWQYPYPGEEGDGLNWVNSHVVNIPKETSSAHFHPPRGLGGGSGLPQREMYLVLDPGTYQLNTWGRTPSLMLWPDLRDLGRYEQHQLEPGMFVYIPPGTGHRGLDVFVNVLTIPGFKPHNEYYLDRAIRDATNGMGPFNASLLNSQNFQTVEDLL
ncbi:MAG: hypothetical protein HZA90_28530 [Verrucomicrobia bacterium]|nr:hypothetical protein [Verrucomicrobiota bacterium]